MGDDAVRWFISGVNVIGHGVPSLDIISGCAFEMFLGEINI